eukprot:CAMPEP_0179360508 /NCGR_PEP_ID=MMETSP0797-20121207/80018_1 /TAXON_ID=47934 /ORGANISM="Dinophysis acuminata, Strain DAEP01" /LENGTH=173 /DNA_ID=CAMNT_0021075875 /DNA_START=1 /DNA_END=520 /DNA_ORIENTATION=+
MFQPADVDGTTLVVDNAKVTERLSAPLKRKMHDLGVRYVRLLYDESERGLQAHGLGPRLRDAPGPGGDLLHLGAEPPRLLAGRARGLREAAAGQAAYQCAWGDGTPLSDDELAELREVQDGAMERVHLEQGDVIAMDNLRVQHGRTTFQGKRVLGLMLSDMVDREAKYQPPAC